MDNMQVAKMQSKLNAEQGGKLKKTTNPKPFRLRTDVSYWLHCESSLLWSVSLVH